MGRGSTAAQPTVPGRPRLFDALTEVLAILATTPTGPEVLAEVLDVVGRATEATSIVLDGPALRPSPGALHWPSGPALAVVDRAGTARAEGTLHVGVAGLVELDVQLPSPAPDEPGLWRELTAIAHALGQALRVTDAERKRARLTARSEVLADHSSDVVIEIDEHLRVVDVGAGAARLLGWVGGRIPSTLDGAVDPRDHGPLSEVLRAVAQTPGEHREVGDLRLCHAQGSSRWFAGTAVDLRGEAHVGAITLILHDITSRKAGEALLHHRAMHDPLTELANRTLLLDRLEVAIRRSAGAGTTIAVALLDLDRFKSINDALGHAAGDELLRVVGRRLRASVRGCDTVARLGGDEFVVLLEELDHAEHADRLLDRLQEVLRAPVSLQGTEHRITASIGVVVPSASPDVDSILRDADAAMYQAKHRGRDRIERFGVGLRQRHLRRVGLGQELVHAIEREQLFVLYQPLHRVDDAAITGVEALLRWRHPTYGPVSPTEFIPIAEEQGTIHRIGRHVLDVALARLAAWDAQTSATHRLSLSVNVSARQLDDAGLVAEVDALLETHGIDPTRLTVEVTESALMTCPDTGLRILEAFRARGIGVAIDDFGTGHSSLATLNHLPATELKIDRSFITGLGHDERDARVVAAIIGLARELGLTTVAEGVETDQQRRVLEELGCDELQGYALARPGELDEVDLDRLPVDHDDVTAATPHVPA